VNGTAYKGEGQVVAVMKDPENWMGDNKILMSDTEWTRHVTSRRYRNAVSGVARRERERERDRERFEREKEQSEEQRRDSDDKSEEERWRINQEEKEAAS